MVQNIKICLNVNADILNKIVLSKIQYHIKKIIHRGQVAMEKERKARLVQYWEIYLCNSSFDKFLHAFLIKKYIYKKAGADEYILKIYLP